MDKGAERRRVHRYKRRRRMYNGGHVESAIEFPPDRSLAGIAANLSQIIAVGEGPEERNDGVNLVV